MCLAAASFVSARCPRVAGAAGIPQVATRTRIRPATNWNDAGKLTVAPGAHDGDAPLLQLGCSTASTSFRQRRCVGFVPGPDQDVAAPEHRTTKRRSPRTNGFVERMNRTLLDECFRVQGRTKWYTAPEEIQRDLDVFMAFYNFHRTHQGHRVAGRAPPQPLLDLIAQQRMLPTVTHDAQEVPLAS